ncbi:MAG: YCF48-related protein [Bacteroidota bacterium]
MFQTTDYGVTWHENVNDGFAPWNKSIAFSNSTTGFGVGFDGMIITSYDAGRTWDYPSDDINRDFNKIFYVAGTFYVAGGNKTNDSVQSIIKSNDNGYTWEIIYDTLGPWLKSIYFISLQKGFAVGDNGVILATTNGGDTWSSITAPLQRDYNAITFINADTGYIVGGTPLGLCRRTILQTVNGGTDWTVLIDTIGGILKDISFADSLIGYTVGDSATVLKTMDGGSNWLPTIVDTNLTGNESFNAVKFYNKDFGVVGGKAGLLYVYQDLPVEAFTMGSDSVGITEATLHGSINTHIKNANYAFVYSNSILFSSSVNTSEVNIQNNSLMLISENIQNLTPNTTYYYYLKATTASDTIYGDTLSFFTGATPPFVFETVYATGIGEWHTILNGLVNKFPVPVNLFFEYGTSPAFGSQVAASPASVNDTLIHNLEANIIGLQANAQYFFRLKGVTASGIYYGDTKMFNAVTLPYILNPVTMSILSLTSVQMNGTVNNNGLPAALKFEYGPTTMYGTEVNAVPDSAVGPGYINTSCILTGLSPSITYHYRLKAINSNGISYSIDFTFNTGAPTVSTAPVSNIGVGSAQLNGSVNANSFPTAIKFEYGLTTLYGNEVNAVPNYSSDTIGVNASYVLTGLSPTTTYHYRIKAINSNGTIYGFDMAFTTGAPFVSTLPVSNLYLTSVQLNGLVNANNFPTANKFEYGTTISFGNEVTAIPDSAFGNSDVNISCQLSGLLQNTTYYYRVKAINSIDTIYGFYLSFNTGVPSASALLASDIGESSAQLNGIVNANNFPTTNIFEYGTSTTYGNQTIAIPDTAFGNSNVNISSHLSGLLPFTIYHYRIKVTNTNGTTYSNDNSFTTGDSLSVITLPANEIAPTSAKLNGSVDAGGIPTAVKFEYGTTTTYGNEIASIPDSAYSIGFIDVFAIPSGLIPNTTYHYRLKGENNAITKYGDDRIFYTGPPEIPNFDFELWTPETIYRPGGWDYTLGKVSQYTPACHGNYAVKLENDSVTNIPGAILIGMPAFNGQIVFGGVPFNARPDTLIGCFNYAIPNNDTALIFLTLKKQGVIISENWFKIFGNSFGNYSELKFPILYTAAGNADSIMIGMVSTDFRNLTPPQILPIGGFLIVDNIRFSGTTLNIPNNDFENWVTDTTYKLTSWYYDNKDKSFPPASRTTDAQHGNYAVLVQNCLSTDTHGSLMTSLDWYVPGFSVNARHQSLTGFYKYFPENNDTMNIGVFMFKNHITVGSGYFHANAEVSS